ncbi:MAG: SPOR domain-containing protein, partial [Spirulina sp. DLM2.Bin59]
PEPSPTPVETPPEKIPNLATAPPSNDPYYYVLVGYDGEDSLRAARGAIPDAYLRQFPQGIRIQMGAFDNAADAQRLVNALQGRGLVGEVHQGQN